MLARNKNNIGMGGRGGGRCHWYEVNCSLVNVSLSCLGRGGGGVDCDRVVVCPCQNVSAFGITNYSYDTFGKEHRVHM